MIAPSARLVALPGYPLAELPGIKRRLIAAGRDVIDLGAGDKDAPPPRVAVEALQAAVENPANSKYGFQQGHPGFRRAASDYVQRRFGHRFDPATELLPLIGSKEGLAHMPFAFVNPGEAVIIPEPGYQAYLGGTLLACADPYVVPLEAEHGFLLNVENIPADVLRRTKLMFLNYPNNPTAAVATLEYLERVVALCRRHQIVLAYDNAYCDIVFDGYRAPSIFEIAGANEVAIEFFSLSKSFSMTGWRIGFAVGRPNLIAPLTRAKTYKDTGPFLAVQEAGAAVLDHAEAVHSRHLCGDLPAAGCGGACAPGRGVRGGTAQGGDVSLGRAARGDHLEGLCAVRAGGGGGAGASGERVRSGGGGLLPDRAHGSVGSAGRSGWPTDEGAGRRTARRGWAGRLNSSSRGRRAGRRGRSPRVSPCTWRSSGP